MSAKLISRQLSRREFLRASALAGAGLIAAQCGGPPATEAPAAPATQAPAAGASKKKVIIAAGADASTEPMRNMINDGLAEESLGFPVEWVELPYNTLYEKLVQVGQNKAADFDLYMMDDPWVPQFAGGGFIRNMTEMGYKPGEGYLEKTLDLGWWPPKAGPRVPGIAADAEPQLYILPIIGDCQIFFYRKDILAEAGIAPPVTWDDIINIGEKLAKPDQSLYLLAARGLRGNPIVTEWFPYLYSYGGDIVDDKWNIVFNQQAGIDALQLFVDLLKWQPPDVANYDSAEQGALYLQGNCIVNIEWTGWISQAEDPAKSKVVGKTGWTIPPKKVRHASEIGNWVMGIGAGSENPDGSLAFLDWFLKDEVQTELAKRKGVPVKRAIYDNKDLQAQFPWLPTIRDALDNSVARPRTPDWAKVEDILGLHLNNAITKAEEVQEALDNAAKEATDYLKSQGYYA
ncbi:MAG: extracellular solute-binding protein [Chloroflexota bacterium]